MTMHILNTSLPLAASSETERRISRNFSKTWTTVKQE